MTKKDQPAFPRAAFGPADDCIDWEGITVRQYYAAKAMQALIISDKDFALTERDVAEHALRQADAMIEAEDD